MRSRRVRRRRSAARHRRIVRRRPARPGPAAALRRVRRAAGAGLCPRLPCRREPPVCGAAAAAAGAAAAPYDGAVRAALLAYKERGRRDLAGAARRAAGRAVRVLAAAPPAGPGRSCWCRCRPPAPRARPRAAATTCCGWPAAPRAVDGRAGRAGALRARPAPCATRPASAWPSAQPQPGRRDAARAPAPAGAVALSSSTTSSPPARRCARRTGRSRAAAGRWSARRSSRPRHADADRFAVRHWQRPGTRSSVRTT